MAQNNTYLDCLSTIYGCDFLGWVPTWFQHKPLLGVDITFVSVADLWKHNKHNAVANVVSDALFWTIWLTRNDICFNSSMWPRHAGDMDAISLQPCLVDRSILLAGGQKEQAGLVVAELESLIRAPHLLLRPEPE
jgi:hypothetical protein